RYISELDVICPRQFEQEQEQELQMTTQQGHGEGETPGLVSCDFKGKVKQVNDHLENSCCLQMVKCWFDSFGCNHTCSKSVIHDHLTSNMKLHFDLVVKSFDTLQQTIRLYQLKGKKDGGVAPLRQQLELDQKDNLQLNSDQVCCVFLFCFRSIQNIQKQETIIKQQTTLPEMQKLKKDIEIQKIKEEMQVKEKKMVEQQKKFEEKNRQINDNKEEQKGNNKNENLSTSVINTSPTSNFELVRPFKLIKTFTGHTNWVWSIDCSTSDDKQFICSGSDDNTVRVWDVDNNKQIQSFNGHSSPVYCVKFSPFHYHNDCQN
ncbi:hypothetical protein RFI_15034, partial [Reticulomyxa filosa]